MIIGLVVLGPERLPRIANQLGGWLGQARRMTRVMKRQLEEELDLGNMTKMKPPPPSSREPSQQPPKEPAKDPEYILPRDDDEFSPEHAPDDVGTGVGDEIYDDEADLAVSEAERDAVAEDSNKRSEQDEQPADDEAEEKAAS